MSLRRTVAAAAAVATVSIASAAWGSPWTLKPGEFYSELSGSVFSANSFYGNSEVRLWLGGKLDERVVRSYNEFGWKKRAAVWIAVPFVSRAFAPFPSGAFASTGFGDIDLGLKLRLRSGTTPVALSLGWTAPLGGNRGLYPGTSGNVGIDPSISPRFPGSNFTDTTLFFDAGLQSLTATLELGGSAGRRALWTLGGGARYRYLEFGQNDEDSAGVTTAFRRAAMAAVGEATLGVWLRPSVLVTGAFRGEWTSWQTKLYDGVVARDLEAVRMLAGPRLTYRVDDRMDVFAGSWHTPGGRHVLHHDQYYCGIAWKQTGLDRLAGALGGTKPR